jgi:hypothetical protein
MCMCRFFCESWPCSKTCTHVVHFTLSAKAHAYSKSYGHNRHSSSLGEFCKTVAHAFIKKDNFDERRIIISYASFPGYPSTRSRPDSPNTTEVYVFSDGPLILFMDFCANAIEQFCYDSILYKRSWILWSCVARDKWSAPIWIWEC